MSTTTRRSTMGEDVLDLPREGDDDWWPTVDDYRCCALDEGHDGCCAWLCSSCNGTGRCPECDGGAMSDGIGTYCWLCDESYACPEGCYEGWLSEDR
jgi:hypothetical protein